MTSHNPSNRKAVPTFEGRLYTLEGNHVGNWVRRAEADALLDEIDRLHTVLKGQQEATHENFLEIERLRHDIEQLQKAASAEANLVERLRGAAQALSDRMPKGAEALAHFHAGAEVKELRRVLSGDSSALETGVSDKALLDWLTEVLVDTIYLDDGRIIDIGGHRQRPHDVRAVLVDAMRALPVSIDTDEESSQETLPDGHDYLKGVHQEGCRKCSAQKASVQSVSMEGQPMGDPHPLDMVAAGYCPICGGKDGEHKQGCVDGDAPL